MDSIPTLFSLLLHVVLAAEIIFYIFPVRSDDTWFGWHAFSEKVETVRKQYPETFIFAADDYKTSAILNFYLNEMVYSKNVVGEQGLQFDYIGTDLHKLNGKDAIYIDSNPRFTNTENENNSVPASYSNYFDQIIPLQPILIENHGRIERKWSVFLCKNYHFRK